MLPDITKSKTVGALYIWDEGKQEFIKIDGLTNTETIGQKDGLQEALEEN